MTAGWNTTTHLANATAIGVATGTSSGVNVTSGAANTKGSWIQIIASTASDITHLMVCVSIYSAALAGAAGPQGAIDIAVAAGGSEASGIIIQNLIVPLLSGTGEHFILPVGQIPAASRIAVRFASTASADIVNISMVGFDSGWSSNSNCSLWDTYGWSGSGAVQGFAVDPGSSINTKGAYTVLSASTTNDYIGFFLTWDVQGRNSSTGSQQNFLIDVSLGAAGVEIPILPNVLLGKNSFTGGVLWGPKTTHYMPMPIAAATRLTCRAQCANATALDRVFGVSFYGLRA